MNVKQVIVLRKDLNMRKGKMVAQGAHASLGVILSLHLKGPLAWSLLLEADSPVKYWLENAFTKICVSVDSEEQLLSVFSQAEAVGIPRCLITDNGTTEFDGVPTKTCCAIGPWHSEEIDKITGSLKLL